MSYKYNRKPELNNSISRFLQSKDIWDNRLWRRLANGLWVTEVNGKFVSEDLFADMFPKFNPVTFVTGRFNLDSTTRWINE